MFRFVLSAASLFGLVFTSLFFPYSADARRCDDRMPLTLLSLYRTSDGIYIGRYDKVEDGEITEDTAEYRAVQIKKHFTISSALKGEPRKLLTIDDTEYRYKDVDRETGDAEVGHDEPELSEMAKPGDAVLLFVKKDAETGVLNLTEMSDGLKKMTPDRIAAYEARIKELKGILAAKKPTHSELVAWMIRCAEDPLTRWEGTFELLQSYENMEWQEEREKAARERLLKGEVGDSDEYVPEEPKEFETGDPGFAKSLTYAHKHALSSILLNRTLAETTQPFDDGMSGDRELIELVKRWGDSKVASGLLQQLRGVGSDTYAKAMLMGSIATMLRDDELGSLSDRYASIQWEKDEDEVVEENEPVSPIVRPTIPSSGDGPAVTAASQAIQIEPDPNIAKKKQTYGELRAELYGKFVSRARTVLAGERHKNVAKARLQ